MILISVLLLGGMCPYDKIKFFTTTKSIDKIEAVKCNFESSCASLYIVFRCSFCFPRLTSYFISYIGTFRKLCNNECDCRNQCSFNILNSFRVCSYVELIFDRRKVVDLVYGTMGKQVWFFMNHRVHTNQLRRADLVKLLFSTQLILRGNVIK